MTRIFEALKKSRISHPPVAAPATPIPSVRAHAAGAVSAATPIPSPERLGLVPRLWEGSLDLPEDVAREMTALRMTLETAVAARAPRTVMFTSAQSGEGTSTVAAQFAAGLAGDPRQRVLLMDLNARRPSPFIEGAARAGESVTPGVRPIHAGAGGPHRLDVVPLPERAREAGVVSAPAAREWIESMSDRYDWIVLDGPAVLEAPDAPPLASIADGVVIVVEAGRTKRPVLHRAIDLLRNARANLIGSVLNRRRLEIPEFLYRRI
jgi:Mrp family chromosome partitioning ATPase